MINRFSFKVVILMVAIFSLASCNFPRPTPTPNADGLPIARTAAAQTVAAIKTKSAATPTPSSLLASATPVQTVTTALTPATKAPTPTLAPSPAPTSTTVPTPCDRAGLISETIPDGAIISPGQAFTKIWTLKNTGTCSWNSSYSLVFYKGEGMSGPGVNQFTTGIVAPNQSVQVSVNLKAPVSAGTFRGEWMLRNASNVLFGLGADASASFWVEIKVNKTSLSFLDTMCMAEWRFSNNPAPLPCPGNPADPNGFVIKVDKPVQAGGNQSSDPALWTNPQPVKNGDISGRYPAILMTRGSHFKTTLGCLNNATSCNVKYTLSYRANGGGETVLKTWDEKYDSPPIIVDLDLSDLAGQSVNFILTVKANDPDFFNQNQAYWLRPRIE
jgi:hypothetical protein